MKKLSFDEILKIDEENFEILHSDIEEARLYRRFPEYKFSIRLNETEHTYNVMAKKTEINENLNPLLHSVLGDKFRANL